jgi:hypothetical protein
MPDHDLIEWVHDHREDLDAIAARFGTDERVTRGLALMVLSGYSDADVYADLAHEVLVWDGQESPLRDVPEALAAVRRLVAQA